MSKERVKTLFTGLVQSATRDLAQRHATCGYKADVLREEEFADCIFREAGLNELPPSLSQVTAQVGIDRQAEQGAGQRFRITGANKKACNLVLDRVYASWDAGGNYRYSHRAGFKTDVRQAFAIRRKHTDVHGRIHRRHVVDEAGGNMDSFVA
jgi:hypothetical protein